MEHMRSHADMQLPQEVTQLRHPCFRQNRKGQADKIILNLI